MRVKIRSKYGFKEVDLNRRKAIREHCLDCSGWSHSEVRDCSHTGCYLYPFRMGKGRQNAKARAKAIRRHCLKYCVGTRTEIRKCVTTTCSLFPYRMKQVDRSTNIALLPKKEHIGPSFASKPMGLGQSPMVGLFACLFVGSAVGYGLL